MDKEEQKQLEEFKEKMETIASVMDDIVPEAEGKISTNMDKLLQEFIKEKD